MAIFKIKETEKIMTAFIYEVEAETKEEALRLYTEELAGSLEPINEFVTAESKEGINIYQY